MTEKHQCSKQVIMDTWGHTAPCEHNAAIQEDGKWWCGRDAPSRVKARREKRELKWDAKWAKIKEKAARKQALAQAQAELLVAAKEMIYYIEDYGYETEKSSALRAAIAKVEGRP